MTANAILLFMESFLKTFLLLTILSILLIAIGGIFGGRSGMIFAFVISLVMNIGSYFFSDKLALSMSGAKPMSKKEHPEIYAMVEDLSKKIDIPMPKLYITPEQQANAFATGRGPGHASVAVTEGIMRTLSKEELRGVLAHELAHVKNRDILVATIAAVIASAISFLAQSAMWGSMTRGDDEENPGAGILGILVIFLAPMAAMLIQFAISRQREFGADETGARTIGDGDPLAKALVAIHDSTRRRPAHVNPAFSSLYIENPIGGFGGAMMKLFSTHPPVEERVKRLAKI
jgi:heat shock protein HtpX